MNISSTSSFWQQDQAWQNQQQSLDQQLNQTGLITSTLTAALTNQTSGLAGIANQQALNRVNSAIATAVNSAAGSSGSSSPGTSSSASSGPAPSGAANTASALPTSTAMELISNSTAASLLSGVIPSGSLLSILA